MHDFNLCMLLVEIFKCVFDRLKFLGMSIFQGRLCLNFGRKSHFVSKWAQHQYDV